MSTMGVRPPDLLHNMVREVTQEDHLSINPSVAAAVGAEAEPGSPLAGIRRHVPALIGAMMLVAIEAHAAPWLLKQADTPATVSEIELDALEDKAKAGDRALKREFAAAYLYEFHYPNIYGCTRLKYGHRCRAMATRTAAGAIFLHEIVNTFPTDRDEIIYTRSFQKHYALALYRLAAGNRVPENPYCQDAIRFFELAIQNGDNCGALYLADMARHGWCMPKDEARMMAYVNKHGSCPTP